jgi:hypothetical protein
MFKDFYHPSPTHAGREKYGEVTRTRYSRMPYAGFQILSTFAITIKIVRQWKFQERLLPYCPNREA